MLAVINLEKDDVSLESGGGAKVEKKERIREQTRTERTGDWVVGPSRRMRERSCAGLAPVFFICSDGGDPAEGHEDRAGKWRGRSGVGAGQAESDMASAHQRINAKQASADPGDAAGDARSAPSLATRDRPHRAATRAWNFPTRRRFPPVVFIVVFPSLRRAPARSPPRCHVHTVTQSGDKLSSKPCR